jgi:protein involved in polysaccharide export with SLBB domain
VGLLAAAMVGSGAGGPLYSQGVTPGKIQQASRTELAQRITELEQQLAGNTLRGKRAEQAKSELASLRDRLAIGDFRVGDRFVITVRTDAVRADTASVRDSLKVSVLNLPDLTLSGTLRSELNDHVNAHVARYVRNAEVRTSVLTRIAIFGAVTRPGYYYASPDRPVSDIVMLAGGPAVDANLDQFQINRARRTMLSFKASRQAIKEGRTLEQLDVQSGDEFQISKKRRINWQLIIQLLFIASSLFFATINFLRLYYDRQE